MHQFSTTENAKTETELSNLAQYDRGRQARSRMWSQRDPSFWDGPTLATTLREPTKRLKVYELYEEPVRRPPNPARRPLQRKDKPENLECSFPGCMRKFVYRAELENHISVLHSDFRGAFELPSQRDLSPDSAPAPKPPSSTRDTFLARFSYSSPDVEGNSTIKATPIPRPTGTSTQAPVTAANLDALNTEQRLTAEESLSNSLRKVSISGSRSPSDDEAVIVDEDLAEYDDDDDDLEIRSTHSFSESEMSVGTTFSAVAASEAEHEVDFLDPRSPRIQLPAHILNQLYIQLWNNFAVRTRPARGKDSSRSNQRTGGNSSSQSTDNQAGPSDTSSNVSGSTSSKRQYPDEDEEKRLPPAKRRNMSPDYRPLACPFNKYDNFMFGGDQTYQTCSTWHDFKTAYLKQHLLRNHCVAEFACDRCGTDMKNAGQLRLHRRSDPPCEVREFDKLKISPEDQVVLALRSRNPGNTSRSLYWFKVYDTIFGSQARAKRPVDPYYYGPSFEVLESFLYFSEVRMPEVIRRSRQVLNLDSDRYNDQHVELVQTILEAASETFMRALREIRPQSLREIKAQNSELGETDNIGDQTIIPIGAAAPVTQWEPTDGHGGTQQQHQESELQRPSSAPLHQQSAHASQFTNPQAMSFELPTRIVNQSLQPPISPYYDQSLDYDYSSLTPQHFAIAPFLGDSEFLATVEDQDMYGPGSLNIGNPEDYDFSNATGK